ncbi:MAG: HNH endonuclease [Bacilli bacterium]
MYYCIYCNKKINSHNKYCSISCQKKYEYETYINEWKNGKRDGMRGKYQISSHIQHYLYEKYNYSCAKCGWNKVNPYTGKSPLEIEHIDGNYLNNTEKNLILLCPNCHSLTATYKGANKGNGRKGRNKYSLYGNPELSRRD